MDSRPLIIADAVTRHNRLAAHRWTLRWILFPSFRRWVRWGMDWEVRQIDKWLCDLRDDPV